MSKKLIFSIFVLISLSMVAHLSAKGPNGGKNGQSPAALTESEIDAIKYMREEEKLARDVYLALFDEYGTSIFGNISQSEQRHMDALKNLIEKHGLEDPVADDKAGAFTDTYFSGLYDLLVASGKESYCAALQVGIDIEELDIEDIEGYLNDAKSKDVSRVLTNLLNGSYNHHNAFASQCSLNECECTMVEY